MVVVYQTLTVSNLGCVDAKAAIHLMVKSVQSQADRVDRSAKTHVLMVVYVNMDIVNVHSRILAKCANMAVLHMY